MDQRTLFDRAVITATHIQAEAIEAATECVQALLEAPRNDRGYTALIREMLATYLFVVAGVLRGRTTMDFVSEDPLEEVYALEPWKFGLKVREALFEIVTNTTLHPPSFVALLELITPCQAEILESQRQGHVFPQEEQLLARTMEAAFNYLHFTSEAEVRDRGFRDILESWQNHANPDIRDLIARIQDDFLS